MPYTAGIDVGSTYTKAVILDAEHRILGRAARPTGGSTNTSARPRRKETCPHSKTFNRSTKRWPTAAKQGCKKRREPRFSSDAFGVGRLAREIAVAKVWTVVHYLGEAAAGRMAEPEAAIARLRGVVPGWIESIAGGCR